MSAAEIKWNISSLKPFNICITQNFLDVWYKKEGMCYWKAFEFDQFIGFQIGLYKNLNQF